jgi:U3 small nucleolar RNA-associated protein 12
MYTNSANPRGDRDDLRVTSGNNGEGGGGEIEESTEVSKSTTETLMAGERIIEALEISEVDRSAKKAYEEEIKRLPQELAKRVPPPSRNPIFSMYQNCQAEEYVLKVVRSIPPASLQDALLVLPFGKVIQLIEHLDYWAQRVSFNWFPTLLFSLQRCEAR